MVGTILASTMCLYPLLASGENLAVYILLEVESAGSRAMYSLLLCARMRGEEGLWLDEREVSQTRRKSR